MSIIKIPEQIIKKCDICKSSDVSWRKQCCIQYSHIAFDFFGNACASISNQYDICDKCFSIVDTKIKELFTNG